MGTIRLIIAFAASAHHVPHVGWPYIGTSRAIHAFMVIGGFYTAMLLSTKYSGGRHPVAAFYFSRFARLYPTFIVTVLLTIAWSLAMPCDCPGVWNMMDNIRHTGTILSDSGRFLLWLPNFSLAGLDIPVLFNMLDGEKVQFAQGSLQGPPLELGNIWLGNTLLIPPSWSLGMMFSFYLLAPLLTPKAGTLGAGAWGAVSALLLYVFGQMFLFGGYFVTPFWFWLFSLGIISYRLDEKFGKRISEFMDNHGWAASGGFLASVCVFLYLFTMGGHFSDLERGILTALVLPVATRSAGKSRLDRHMGKLSYPLFCSHMLFSSYAWFMNGQLGMSEGLVFPLTLLMTLVYSELVVRLVENPLEPFRARMAEGIRTGFPDGFFRALWPRGGAQRAGARDW